jgi:RNA polymerase sigma factor (sigma-70 family)
MDNLQHTEASDEGALLIEVFTIARQFARRRFPNDVAEDVAQDIVLECLVTVRAGKCGIKVSLLPGFVRHLVRLRSCDVLRRNHRRANTDEYYARALADTQHVWMSPEMTIDVEELEDFRVRTLASLPCACRRAYLMVREDEESYRAVAEQLGVSRAAVSWHVAEAHRRFRAGLIEQELLATYSRSRKRTSIRDASTSSEVNS